MTRMPWKALALAAVLVAGLAGLIVQGRARAADAATPPSPAALPVQTLTLEAADAYEVAASYAGRVVSRRVSELGFERSGRLERVLFDEGERVEEGELLAVLDTRALRARRRELAAQVKESRARLNLAKLTTERRRKLRESDHVSQQVLDEAVFEEQALGARLAAARASLATVDVDLELSELRAPYAGQLTARHLDEGTVVTPGHAIFRILEDRAMEVRIGLPPEIAASLVTGELQSIQVGDRRFEAALEAVLDSVEPDTRTVTAIFRFEDPEARVTHGALARVALSRKVAADGFWLPITALAESRRGLWSAYAVVFEDDDPGIGRVDRREVQVIHAEVERAFVRGTLRDGERVVATGLHRLVPGQRVRVTD